jgi:hypothetical protein
MISSNSAGVISPVRSRRAFAANRATALAVDTGLLTPPDPRGAAIARFAANARRLRTGEITPAEFDEIMAADDRDRPDA